MKKLIALLIVQILLLGCSVLTGEEIGRLQINEISSENNLILKETSLELLKGDEISIWSDMDFEYEGDATLIFKMGILKDKEIYRELEFDPTDKNITIGEVKSTIMNKTDWSFTGKNTEIPIDEDGTYTFKALLASTVNSSLRVNKAEIILKK
jgi:hypothetical protein